jgi:hypothetical protein
VARKINDSLGIIIAENSQEEFLLDEEVVEGNPRTLDFSSVANIEFDQRLRTVHSQRKRLARTICQIEYVCLWTELSLPVTPHLCFRNRSCFQCIGADPPV